MSTKICALFLLGIAALASAKNKGQYTYNPKPFIVKDKNTGLKNYLI